MRLGSVPLLLVAAGAIGCADTGRPVRPEPVSSSLELTPPFSDAKPNPQLAAEGKEIFRHDTYGDETFWTDQLRMHEVIAGGANGAVGPGGVTPATALAVGLKVDADALPQSVKDAIAAGKVNLNDPATTVALLQLGAVVGLKGTVETTASGAPRLARVGITC